jgi:hypothetical protein
MRIDGMSYRRHITGSVPSRPDAEHFAAAGDLACKAQTADRRDMDAEFFPRAD